MNLGKQRAISQRHHMVDEKLMDIPQYLTVSERFVSFMKKYHREVIHKFIINIVKLLVTCITGVYCTRQQPRCKKTKLLAGSQYPEDQTIKIKR